MLTSEAILLKMFIIVFFLLLGGATSGKKKSEPRSKRGGGFTIRISGYQYLPVEYDGVGGVAVLLPDARCLVVAPRMPE